MPTKVSTASPTTIDYKKELETASKRMIMVHDPKLLIKMIVRMLVGKLQLKHAAMILFDPVRDEYILDISRGKLGDKIPTGFTRFTSASPLIKVYLKQDFKSLWQERNALVCEDINKMIWRESVLDSHSGVQEVLHELEDQMHMLNSLVSVPAFYQDQLMAVLLLGAKGDESKYTQTELDFFAALASDAAMAIRNAQLFDGLKQESLRNKELFIQTIIALGAAIEAKDAYTQGHTQRVTQYALTIARQMVKNQSISVPESFFENLYISGLLHDIGKIGVPEAILNKQGPLSDEEYSIMKNHTLKGAEIVNPLNLSKEIVDGIKYHHEMFNGKGYPEGLKGEAIPISAAIMAVADAYDAMTSDRPYRKGLSHEIAMEEIRKKSNTQFHPLAAQAMLEIYSN